MQGTRVVIAAPGCPARADNEYIAHLIGGDSYANIISTRPVERVPQVIPIGAQFHHKDIFASAMRMAR